MILTASSPESFSMNITANKIGEINTPFTGPGPQRPIYWADTALCRFHTSHIFKESEAILNEIIVVGIELF